MWERRLSHTLVIEHREQLIGYLVIDIHDGWAQREAADQARGVEAVLGWAFDPRFGGRGLATEALEGLLRVCFETLDFRRVTAEAFAANESSWRLMERVGMRREFYAPERSLHRELGWLDSVGYGLLSHEWRECRELPRA